MTIWPILTFDRAERVLGNQSNESFLITQQLWHDIDSGVVSGESTHRIVCKLPYVERRLVPLDACPF